MIDLTFRVIRFPDSDMYIALAWNYESTPPVFLATPARHYYSDARRLLNETIADSCAPGGEAIRLRWFDGFYEYDAASGQITPALDASSGLPRAVETYPYA